MDRKAQILRGINKADLGLEIAPWFNPTAAKRDGYNIKTLDVFDDETLQIRARENAEIPPESYSLLEKVDFVGSATEMAQLIPQKLHGHFDYIISSHNFEHLPNPIKFLRACQSILKPGGLISMAVPDGRACFDFFRPHSTTGEWVEAYTTDRSRPSPRQIFDGNTQCAYLSHDGDKLGAFWLGADPEKVFSNGDISKNYKQWIEPAGSDEYIDAHCSVMTPASFELLIKECAYLGLINLEVENISKPRGCEFYVRLRAKDKTGDKISAEQFRLERTLLLRKIWRERAMASAPKLRDVAKRYRFKSGYSAKSILKKITGKGPK